MRRRNGWTLAIGVDHDDQCTCFLLLSVHSKKVVKKRPDNGTTGFSFDFLKIICTDHTQTHTTTYTRIRTRLLLLLLLLRRRCSCASFALY